MKRTVFYSDFGAIGDGVAEDFSALKRCHEYANENSCKVCADAGATYYIGDTDGEKIIVKTDVDFKDATFIIDDTSFPVSAKARTTHLFVLTSDYEKSILDEDSEVIKRLNAAGGIKSDATNVGYAPGYPAMLVVIDNEHSAYNRYGTLATGKVNPQRELVIVDAEGNIDLKTKFLLDTKHVSVIEQLRIDDEPITLEGGTFITKANCAPSEYNYYSRGFCVERSNVTIKNLVHKIVGEGETGAPYIGFIIANRINNLRCERLTLQSHKSYKDYGPDGKFRSTMGSYDIGGRMATNVCFYDCHQSNFYKDKERGIAYDYHEYWGIMGTNYCKNLIYDKCTLSRLDAHSGVYNVVIKDTTISFIALTGGGTALIENSTIVSPDNSNGSLFQLRGDYGSTWKGDVIIKDCTYVNDDPNRIMLTYAIWANWDFGYKTYLPRVTLDNLKFAKPGVAYLYPILTRDKDIRMDEEVLYNGEKNLNPMKIDAPLIIKNNTAGIKYIASENDYVNSKIHIIEE